MKVLIDPGHGIDTPGKRSPDGSFLEYLWNRQIADLVIARLVTRGVDASLVVTETNDISLRTRAMRVNRICDQVGTQNPDTISPILTIKQVQNGIVFFAPFITNRS